MGNLILIPKEGDFYDITKAHILTNSRMSLNKWFNALPMLLDIPTAALRYKSGKLLHGGKHSNDIKSILIHKQYIENVERLKYIYIKYIDGEGYYMQQKKQRTPHLTFFCGTSTCCNTQFIHIAETSLKRHAYKKKLQEFSGYKNIIHLGDWIGNSKQKQGFFRRIAKYAINNWYLASDIKDILVVDGYLAAKVVDDYLF